MATYNLIMTIDLRKVCGTCCYSLRGTSGRYVVFYCPKKHERVLFEQKPCDDFRSYTCGVVNIESSDRIFSRRSVIFGPEMLMRSDDEPKW